MNDEIFELVQNILKSHRGGKRRRIYILSGLLRCQHCGSRYIGVSSNEGRHFYYRCGNVVRRFPLPRNCSSKPVKADRIESAVVGAIKNAVARPEILINHILGLARKILENGKRAKEENDRLVSRKKSLESKKTKLLELYLEGLIQKSTYLEKKKEIEETERDLQKTKEDMSEILPYINSSLLVQNIKYFSKLARKRIDELEPLKLREFLAYLIDEIRFDSNKMEIKISGHIPIVKSMDESSAGSMSHFLPGLTPATRNNKLGFELEAKV